MQQQALKCIAHCKTEVLMSAQMPALCDPVRELVQLHALRQLLLHRVKAFAA